MITKNLYIDQKLEVSEIELLTKKYLSKILSNYSIMSKRQIFNELINLNDLITRYS